MVMLYKDNVDDVVVYDKHNYSQIIFNHTFLYPSFIPKIFQINKRYNINNIIIFGVCYVI